MRDEDDDSERTQFAPRTGPLRHPRWLSRQEVSTCSTSSRQREATPFLGLVRRSINSLCADLSGGVVNLSHSSCQCRKTTLGTCRLEVILHEGSDNLDDRFVTLEAKGL